MNVPQSRSSCSNAIVEIANARPGAGAACVLLVPLKAFHVTQGQPSFHYTAGLDGEPNKRGYCSACGSRLTGGETQRSIGIHAGSLDDPSVFRPQVDIHVADAQPWDTMDPSVPKHELYPDV